MEKKIEKLEIRIVGEKTVKEDILNLYSGLMELFDKINEIIEWIEEQEKELPKPAIRETIKPSWEDTELVFERCDKNLLESIFGKDKRDEEVENNTEEWEKVESEDWRTILTRYFSDMNDPSVVRSDGKIRNLIEFIEVILKERSFSKEELFALRDVITEDYDDMDSYVKLREKIDRLLSLEK